MPVDEAPTTDGTIDLTGNTARVLSCIEAAITRGEHAHARLLLESEVVNLCRSLGLDVRSVTTAVRQ